MNVKYLLFFLLMGGMISCQSSDEYSEETQEPKKEQEEESTCQAWQDFVSRSERNVLLDFSYAGYKRGEMAPPDIWTLGYKKYDITKYGAVPDDGKSDRAAFMRVLEEIGINHNPNARAIIYFPEGEFVLYDENDKVDGKSETMQIRAGNLVLKGAGRAKTSIVMKAPYQPLEGLDYAGPMIEFKHWSGFTPELSDIVGDAVKGSFSIEVASASGLSAGDWVCLKLEDNSPELIAQELKPYAVSAQMTQLRNKGVQVYDIHQVKSVRGNKVTFFEPLLYGVEKKWKWKLCRYNYYENIGIEDMSFYGNAPKEFIHDQWAINSAYKPINFHRIANSWVRRVDFYSVSESVTFTECANVSAYDIRIGGNRGHCAVHTSGSSRVLIADVVDEGESSTMKDAGQWHAVGVSKHSLGTVIKNCIWGRDTNFESHATQPRATLIDGCSGGFIHFHQGGATDQLPNHLDDLTLWNFKATYVLPGEAVEWKWWNEERDWKFLPPTIVGFHGAGVQFVASQVKIDQDHGKAVTPWSLYEAQLQRRLGYLPDISYLK